MGIKILSTVLHYMTVYMYTPVRSFEVKAGLNYMKILTVCTNKIYMYCE